MTLLSLKKRTSLALTALAVMLCLLCAAGLHTAAADPAKTYTEGTLRYTFNGSTITITGYFGTDEEVTIPSVIAGYAVSEIASGAFADTAARIVRVPSSVVTLHEDSFAPGMTVIMQLDNRPESETAAQPGTDPDGSTEAASEARTVPPSDTADETPTAAGTDAEVPETAEKPADGDDSTPGGGSRSGCASSSAAGVLLLVPAAILIRKETGKRKTDE